MIKLLTFTTLYPNSVNPAHGIFVETRLRHLVASGEVQSKVIAPVPWFPSKHPLFGEYAAFSAVPRVEVLNGIEIRHPRYLVLPKIGMTVTPFTLARAGIAAARKLIAEGYDFDVIDAHYFYPDGVAAVMMGKALGKPVVVTARGTDINLIPRYALPRRMILWAAEHCAEIITVCAALKDELVALGADGAKITVLRNGVDLKLFRPEDRGQARAALNITRYSLAAVGRLVEAKGHDLIIRALPQLQDVELLIAGTGPCAQALRELTVSLGVADRVRFLGRLSQGELRTLYSAVDALVLASVREGWPNVLLEAMACGTPVITTRLAGCAEVVTDRAAGVLMRERSSSAIAEHVTELRRDAPDRAETRRYAERFSWDDSTVGQVDLFKRACSTTGELRAAALRST
ncbi:MAG TPA: glycosyltransferase family 4 protein [Burkholderiales bacterium]|nr:glycosyltransferase family 4 protein [Burkholderiales bacterium]